MLMNNDNAIIYMKIEKKESLPNLEKNLAERDLSKIRIAFYKAVHPIGKKNLAVILKKNRSNLIFWIVMGCGQRGL